MKTRLKSLAKMALPLIAGALVLSAAPSAEATLLIDQTFDGTTDPFSSDWSRTNATYVGIFDGSLRLYRDGTTTARDGIAAFYTGSGSDSSLVDGKIADFSASVLVNTGTSIRLNATTTSFGLIARNNTTTNSVGSNGYYIGLLGGNATNGVTLGIWNNTGTNNNNVTSASALAKVSVSAVTEQDYLLEVLAIGANITASLWGTDGNGNKTETLLGEISINNAQTAEGYFGIRMGPGNTNTAAYFNNLQVHSIPEPATALLLLPAAAILLYRKRRAA